MYIKEKAIKVDLFMSMYMYYYLCGLICRKYHYLNCNKNSLLQLFINILCTFTYSFEVN